VSRLRFLLAAVPFALATTCTPAVQRPRAGAAASAPLPSWNDGAAKAAIERFVANVTTLGGPGYVPAAERIAVFDDDGTLWAEQPVTFQLQFAVDRVRALAPRHPEWRKQEPFDRLLADSTKSFLASGGPAVAAAVAAHAGTTTDSFAVVVRDWLRTARDAKTGRPYSDLVYIPMLELLDYLRASGFKTYIISGDGVEFVRSLADSVCGIPPEQVIGSQGKLRFESRDGKPALVKLPEVQLLDDGPGKPAAIQALIGRRPLAAFGNSDGDRELLEWTWAGTGARLALLVHHTDAAREWAYDRDSPIGRLDKALDEASRAGWTVVDMKQDWKQVFPVR